MTRQCVGCRALFEAETLEAELCDVCNGWCKECGTPIGVGGCNGCIAWSCADAEYRDGIAEGFEDDDDE